MEKSPNHPINIQMSDCSTKLDNKSDQNMKNVWVPNSSSAASQGKRFSELISPGKRAHLAVIASLFLSSTILASLLTYYVVLNSTKLKEMEKLEKLCTSKGCVESAASILQSLDLNVNPCDDFYKFTCGKFLNSKSIPDDHFVFGTLQQIEEYSLVEMRKFLEANVSTSFNGDATIKMKLFFNSCMQDKFVSNENRTVRTLIENLDDGHGFWSLLKPLQSSLFENKENQFLLENKLVSAYMYQSPSIFGIRLLSDYSENMTKNDLCIFPGSTVIQDEYLASFNKSDKYNEYKEHYRDYMFKVISRVESILSANQSSNNNKSRIGITLKRLDEIIKFESALAELTVAESSEPQEAKSAKDVQWMNITQLQETFPHINWTYFFNRLADIGGTRPERICIENREYLANLSNIFDNQNKQIINDYLCWSILARFVDYLGSQFKRLLVEFRRKVPVFDNQRIFFSRWKECVFFSTRAFQAPASSVYWKHRKDYVIYASQKVHTMLHFIKVSISEIIDHQKWLTEEVRDLLKNRIQESQLKVAFPDYIHQEQLVNEQFKNLTIDLKQVFISNWLNIVRHQQRSELQKLNDTFDGKTDWLLPVTEANAFYDWSLKLIILPMGILHKPIISGERPGYLEFSTLGHVLGHEVGHAMERETYENNENGSDSKIWAKEMRNEYERRGRCFAERFSSFKLQEINEYVNGNTTLTENICDYIGLQQAFNAWKKFSGEKDRKLPGLTNFTNEQLFFIQYGQLFCEVLTEEGVRRTWARDAHSLGQFRVNGILMDTPQFSRAFHCPINSPMNPKDKCDLFLYDPK